MPGVTPSGEVIHTFVSLLRLTLRGLRSARYLGPGSADRGWFVAAVGGGEILMMDLWARGFGGPRASLAGGAGGGGSFVGLT